MPVPAGRYRASGAAAAGNSLDQGNFLGPAPNSVDFIDFGQRLGGFPDDFPARRTGSWADPDSELFRPCREPLQPNREPWECIARSRRVSILPQSAMRLRQF